MKLLPELILKKVELVGADDRLFCYVEPCTDESGCGRNR